MNPTKTVRVKSYFFCFGKFDKTIFVVISVSIGGILFIKLEENNEETSSQEDENQIEADKPIGLDRYISTYM